MERSPLATEAKIRQLLQRSQPRRNARSRKEGREKEKLQATSAQDSSMVSMDFLSLFLRWRCAGGLRRKVAFHFWEIYP